jgi:hypothetical protein
MNVMFKKKSHKLFARNQIHSQYAAVPIIKRIDAMKKLLAQIIPDLLRRCVNDSKKSMIYKFTA